MPPCTRAVGNSPGAPVHKHPITARPCALVLQAMSAAAAQGARVVGAGDGTHGTGSIPSHAVVGQEGDAGEGAGGRGWAVNWYWAHAQHEQLALSLQQQVGPLKAWKHLWQSIWSGHAELSACTPLAGHEGHAPSLEALLADALQVPGAVGQAHRCARVCRFEEG